MLDDLRQTLVQTLGTVGLEPTDRLVSSFCLHAESLLRWNPASGLTSITDEKAMGVKHFVDSLVVLPLTSWEGRSVVDVGTGGGFPGLPIRVARPRARLTLVESSRKKAAFLTHLCRELGVEDVEIAVGRAETLGHDAEHRERYDIAVARAIGSLATAAELGLPLVRTGGVLFSYKGRLSREELDAGRRAVEMLGGRVEDVSSFDLPLGYGRRTIVTVEKRFPCPARFPRRPGLPRRRPLPKG